MDRRVRPPRRPAPGGGLTGFWPALGIGRSRCGSSGSLAVLFERREGVALLTSAAVVAEVWRGGPCQARLAVALRAADVAALTAVEGRGVGVLLGRHGGEDVPDGHVALLAGRHPGGAVATGDRGDLESLGVARDRIIDV